MVSYFLSLYAPNVRDFIDSDLLQRWDLAGFKLTITQIFPSGQGFLNCMIKFPQFPPQNYLIVEITLFENFSF